MPAEAVSALTESAISAITDTTRSLAGNKYGVSVKQP